MELEKAKEFLFFSQLQKGQVTTTSFRFIV